MRMAEGGMGSEEYRTFLQVWEGSGVYDTYSSCLLVAFRMFMLFICVYLQQPSGNMDDSGFFSIQVSNKVNYHVV